MLSSKQSILFFRIYEQNKINRVNGVYDEHNIYQSINAFWIWVFYKVIFKENIQVIAYLSSTIVMLDTTGIVHCIFYKIYYHVTRRRAYIRV